MGLLVRELRTLYEAFVEGRPSPLPKLPVQYADFAVWQTRVVTGGGPETSNWAIGESNWREHRRCWICRLTGHDQPRRAIAVR